MKEQVKFNLGLAMKSQMGTHPVFNAKGTGGKAAMPCCWPLTPNAQVKERVQLHM